MEILLDIDRNLADRANYLHHRNTRKTRFLDAKQVSGDSPGVSTDDWLFRDPWGMPYVITIDMNDNGKCIDAFYGTKGGNGLVQIPAGQPNAGMFELNNPVMIWSYGPDTKAGASPPGGDVNKDNVLGWQ